MKSRPASRSPAVAIAFALALAVGCAIGCASAEKKADPSPTAATAASEPARTSLPDRDATLARTLIRDEDALVLDVRTSREFAEGHIAGATNIDVAVVQDQLSQIEALVDGDKDKAIVVMCRSGRRAARAKATLEEAGFTRVTNVGGWTALCTEVAGTDPDTGAPLCPAF